MYNVPPHKPHRPAWFSFVWSIIESIFLMISLFIEIRVIQLHNLFKYGSLYILIVQVILLILIVVHIHFAIYRKNYVSQIILSILIPFLLLIIFYFQIFYWQKS